MVWFLFLVGVITAESKCNFIASIHLNSSYLLYQISSSPSLSPSVFVTLLFLNSLSVSMNPVHHDTVSGLLLIFLYCPRLRCLVRQRTFQRDGKGGEQNRSFPFIVVVCTVRILSAFFNVFVCLCCGLLPAVIAHFLVFV